LSKQVNRRIKLTEAAKLFAFIDLGVDDLSKSDFISHS